LTACLAESQFEECSAQHMLHFRATVLLGGHLFEILWVGRRRGGDRSSGCLVWAGQKIGTFFKQGKYNNCTLNSEMNAKWHCCLGDMGAETWEMAATSDL
jgi:hypothetical protein